VEQVIEAMDLATPGVIDIPRQALPNRRAASRLMAMPTAAAQAIGPATGGTGANSRWLASTTTSAAIWVLRPGFRAPAGPPLGPDPLLPAGAAALA